MSEEEVKGFKNDGSFLEQFKKMQEGKKQQEEAKTASLALKGLKTGPISMKIGRGKKTFGFGKLQKSRPTTSAPTTSRTLEGSNCDSEDTLNKPPDQDKPPPVCSIPLATPTATPHSLTTLTPSSPHTITGSDSQSGIVHITKESTATSSPSMNAPSGTASRKRKRKSRWGETPSTEDTEIAKAMASFTAPSASSPSSSASSSSSQLLPGQHQQLTIEQQQQLQEQIAMNKMVAEVQGAAQLLSQSKRRKKKDGAGSKYEYDSDEETEGGTWEHKARVAEMDKTKCKAKELTELAKGKHHIGDFLPPEELDKFMERVAAIKEGRTPDLTDYKDHKLTEENVGFKLLQKAGWSEGSGLGSKEDGIQAPINKGKTSFDQAGLGAEVPGEVKKEDNAFETYRKRMMLAYRFRPNPLNNPRRPYY